MIAEKIFYCLLLLLPLIARAVLADHHFGHGMGSIDMLILPENMVGLYVVFVAACWVYLWRKTPAAAFSFLMYSPVMFCFLLFLIQYAPKVGEEAYHGAWPEMQERLLVWLRLSGTVVAVGYVYVGLGIMLRGLMRMLRVVKA